MPSIEPVSAQASDFSRQQLEQFVKTQGEVSLAVLTSADGFEIATHPPGHPAAQRIAAMSSSMQALGEAMSREAGFINNRSLIIESSDGVIVILSLVIESSNASLAVVATGKAVLGQLLWACRECCVSLESSLQLPAA